MAMRRQKIHITAYKTLKGKARVVALYEVWRSMRQRCYNPNNKSFRHYGGRGISICEEWSKFIIFRQWALSAGYGKGLSIERIDNDGHYCPENCTWIPIGEQAANQQKTIHITFNGITMCRKHWANHLGVNQYTLKYRLEHWPLEKALTKWLKKLVRKQ